MSGKIKKLLLSFRLLKFFIKVLLKNKFIYSYTLAWYYLLRNFMKDNLTCRTLQTVESKKIEACVHQDSNSVLAGYQPVMISEREWFLS